MRVLLINSVCGIGSTGRICTELAQEYERGGADVKIAYGRKSVVPDQFRKYAVRIGNDWDVRMHGLKSRLFDAHGLGSEKATRKFLEWADDFNPDLLWLHNIHGYYINYVLLFEWIKSRPQMEVKWTLHDCWAFVGHCTHFQVVNCTRWTKCCDHCSQLSRYPASIVLDRSKRNFLLKKKSFTGVKNMKLIVPSKWLKQLVTKSFLCDYPVDVVYNKIDTSVFKPTPSDFRERYDLNGKIILLGVANGWDKYKGLEDFFQLSLMLDDRFAIVLVGLSKQKMKKLTGKNYKGRHTFSGGNWVRDRSTTGVLINSKAEDLCVDSSADAFSYRTQNNNDGALAQSEILKSEKGMAIPPSVDDLYRSIVQICRISSDQGEGRPEIICLSKTSSKELAEIYSAADIFVNPTTEDNYPSVNLEAMSCGTFVLTYNTGGCAETIASPQ